MGKQSKKIKYKVDEIGNKLIQIRKADDGLRSENQADIAVFIVDGEPWVKASDIVKAIGQNAVVRGAVALLESVNFKRNKDYYVTAIHGFTGNHAVMKLEKAITFLERLNVPLMKPELYEYISVDMKNDVRRMMSELPIEELGGYTLKNNKLHSRKEAPKEKPQAKQDDKIPTPVSEPMRLIMDNLLSQTKAIERIAETLETLRKDRADMAAMIDYQSRDIKKIKEQVNQLFLDLMN